MPRLSEHAVYLKVAKTLSKMSYAKRLKVCAIIVKDNSIISYGYNGTPYGHNNITEVDGHTLPTVVHAEINAICKAAKSTFSTDGATMYATHSPCIECAKAIIQSGIKSFYYTHEYRLSDGLELLKLSNILLKKI